MHTVEVFRIVGVYLSYRCDMFNLFGLEMDQWVAELLWGYVWVRCLPKCVARMVTRVIACYLGRGA